MQPTHLRFQRKDPTLFSQTIRQRVDSYFKENGIKKTGTPRMYAKTAAMFALYFVPFGVILSGTLPNWAAIPLFAMMGIGLSGIGLSIMHDANHGSYSRNKTLNNILGYSLNVIGGSSFTWKVQHNILHHTYTNIYSMDEDIHDKPFLRLSPYGKYAKHHRFQHLYALALYSLATISWVLLKDFKQLITYNRSGLTSNSGHKPARETAIMIVSKVLYFAYIFALPIALGVAWWAVLLGFLIMHMIAGILITIIFQLAHVVEGPEHHEPNPTGTMENTWAIHQLRTTANFSKDNPFVSWFVGGLNYQIEHHLFPHICHVHYRKISSIVKDTALEFGLPYYENPRFFGAVASHFRVLRQLGRQQMVVAG
jgi:linoleoyl-CoA desaturase